MGYSMERRQHKIHKLVIPTPFLVGPVNVYLIKGDTLTLVDTGPKTDEALESLTKQVKELGYKLEDIEQVILTHHHPDHVGLLDTFKNAHILGHRKNNPWITKDPLFLEKLITYFEELYRSHGVEENFIKSMKETNEMYMSFSCKTGLDGYLGDGDDVRGLHGWKVMESPGHAQSHIVLYDEQSSTMIAGDHLIKDISSNAIIEAPYDGETERPKTLLQYRESMKRMLDLDLNVVHPGHGIQITEPKKLIQERLVQHEKRANYIKSILVKAPQRTFDISKILFSKIYEKQPSLTFSEVLGHLDLLENQGEVIVEERNGFFYYKSK